VPRCLLELIKHRIHFCHGFIQLLNRFLLFMQYFQGQHSILLNASLLLVTIPHLSGILTNKTLLLLLLFFFFLILLSLFPRMLKIIKGNISQVIYCLSRSSCYLSFRQINLTKLTESLIIIHNAVMTVHSLRQGLLMASLLYLFTYFFFISLPICIKPCILWTCTEYP